MCVTAPACVTLSGGQETRKSSRAAKASSIAARFKNAESHLVTVGLKNGQIVQ